MTFDKLFATATSEAAHPNGREPFDYQRRLALDPECQSRLIEIPTGLGKTAAVVLAWLWNRVVNQTPTWPRRLVYCLPMRTLVEQTAGEVKKWLENLSEKADELGLDQSAKESLIWLAANSPVVLMGGEDSGEWDIHPEREAILIGTQDMLLSRALNRGYGMSRYRWPMHFGLLNNDCLWVLDETQLMGVGVETSAQLDAFRESNTVSECLTWWMSATLDRTQLATVDHKEPASGWPTISLSESDRSSPVVRGRIEAGKTLTASPLFLSSTTKGDYAKHVTGLVTSRHTDGSLTLVVVNRVARAQAIYSALLKAKVPKERLALIHSRFRPADRQRHQSLLTASGDRIIVATQAIEAGVDISARLLITELAPWASLVQRFGRCNRAGEFPSGAGVIWINLDTASDDLSLPYSAEELNTARDGLNEIGSDVGAVSLDQISAPAPRIVRPVLRRKDLLDLFDTTPDLCGNDLDVSRYIRDGDETDVQVFWRTVPDGGPAQDTAAPTRPELCRVSLGEFAKFLSTKKPAAFIWNALEDCWQEAKKPRPGGLYLVAVESGGYSQELGWTREPKDQPAPLPNQQGRMREGISGDPNSFVGRWLSLQDHTAHVIAATQDLIKALSLTPNEIAALETAALWHDTGKAHPIFQQNLPDSGTLPDSDTIWAKSAGRGGRPARKGFRHELASALAWLLKASHEAQERDLVAYLIAAHHGKVRLSIRALPNEKAPDGAADRLHARGIWDGEELPAGSLPGGENEPVKLDLSFMKMGDGPHGPSWLARTIALRDRLGPFRMAYLETLLRAADIRASAAESSSQPVNS
jgi:CRISPR-associated endonuclease/helicase Cas3